MRAQQHMGIFGGGEGEDSRQCVGVKPEDVAFGHVKVRVFHVGRSEAAKFFPEHIQLLGHGTPLHHGFLLRPDKLAPQLGYLEL